MYKLTEHTEITSYLAEADRARKKIAAVADILFRLSQNDPTIEICDTLTAAVLSFGTENVPDVSGIKKYLYLARVLEKIDDTEEKLNKFQPELKGALTEFYKENELLGTLLEQLVKESDILSEIEKEISGYISSDAVLSENERQLLEHQVKDINMSQMVAVRNRKLIDTMLKKNNSLISGIVSVDTTLLPLWRAQLSQAKVSCTADDIKRSFETGRLTAEKIFSFAGRTVKK